MGEIGSAVGGAPDDNRNGVPPESRRGMEEESIGRVVFAKFEAQETSVYKEQRELRFFIQNHGSSPIRLTSLEPLEHEGVSLVQTRDSTSETIDRRRGELCAALTTLANTIVVTGVESAQAEYRDFVEDLLRNAAAKKVSRLSLMSSWFLRGRIDRIAKFLGENAARLTVESHGDAQRVANLIREMNASNRHPGLLRVFNHKMELLGDAEKELNEIGQQDTEKSLAVIEPGSFFATTYVVMLSRGFLDPKSSMFRVEYAYTVERLSKQGATGVEHRRDGVSETLEVAPQPAALSAMAALGSLVGSTLKTVSLWKARAAASQTVAAQAAAAQIAAASSVEGATERAKKAAEAAVDAHGVKWIELLGTNRNRSPRLVSAGEAPS